MKLISVKILGNDFRSLAANKLYKFNVNLRDDRLSTKIFAGLNGSGKSNFLELFSEIFYFLEVFHLDTVSKEEKFSKAFGFEIEYFLPFDSMKNIRSHKKGKNEKTLGTHVRIVKPLGDVPEFLIKASDETRFLSVEKDTKNLLPAKVIAYTSGQNELLSNPYYKLKYHYFKIFEDKKKIEDGEELAEDHRLFFLDYNTNFSIFIANMLLANELKVGTMKSVIRIEDLQSFRITINTDELYKRVIPLNKTLADNLIKLKLCSTSWMEKKVGKFNLLILDYYVDEATKEAFLFHFKTAFGLYKLFYELEIFNLYLVRKRTRDLMLRVHKTYNVSEELPRLDPSRLVFRIEKIFISKQVDKSKFPKSIRYNALSDGEHQFNEVIGIIMMMEKEGCLFLIDEPATHFNPKWRAKFIKMINYMAALTFDKNGNVEKVRKQEIIVTTHSPFVISDSVSEDVYRFVKKDGVIEYTNPKEEVYGAEISIILEEIFDQEETISAMAKKELQEMIEGAKTKADLRRIVNRLNTEFGESVQKFDLFSKLQEIKKTKFKD